MFWHVSVHPSVCPRGGWGSVSRGGSAGRGQWGGGQSAGGVSQWGGVSRQGGCQLPGGGSAKIGQQNEYSLHGGRYASCVHAGGLSCCIICLESCNCENFKILVIVLCLNEWNPLNCQKMLDFEFQTIHFSFTLHLLFPVNTEFCMFVCLHRKWQ